jgi:chromosomal replication initiator protein
MDPNNEKVWSDVLENIKVSVSPAIYTTWFAQTHLSSVIKQGDRFVCEVGCNSSFVRSTIEGRYFGLVQENLQKALGSSCDLLFIVKENPNKKVAEVNSTPLFSNNITSKSEDVINAIQRVGIRQSFTFQNFAVSSSNQMAWAAAEAVSNDLGQAYNPLFLWGGVGVGKTHLMSAVGHKALQLDSSTNIICCTGEQFTNDIVEGIRNKSTQNFRNKYRKVKLLLIDDIQFIAGKDAVQEEFFHTFNALVAAGSQIILTSDRPPSEISKLEERLRSRFEAGLIVDIAPPDFELRCAITQIKIKEKGLNLPMDIVQLIAGNLESARKIEGFLIKASSEANIKRTDITKDLVETLLGKRDGGEVQNLRVNPNDLISAVGKYYSLGKRSLLGSSRSRPVARPRQILMYLLRTELQLPLEEVGRLIGNRDHTTVMHAVEKITNLASSDVNIREDIRGIKNNI